ncbi:hypothetical protein ACFR99_12455 [Haloarchaeobius amylolyticus]|uniref:Uncharacterized protein n=1 Tax=Haloarchaeobius amylolyticus TaxID=1198296 RepID=A0ABD6BH11_9EURY
MIEHTSKDALRNDPLSANEDVAKLCLQLRHISLEELEEQGLVRWERDEHLVTKGPLFDEKRPEYEID